MKLFNKDGITVQAITPQQEALYKSLGFKPVEEKPKPEPMEETPKPESKKDKGKGKGKETETPPETPTPEG